MTEEGRQQLHCCESKELANLHAVFGLNVSKVTKTSSSYAKLFSLRKNKILIKNLFIFLKLKSTSLYPMFDVINLSLSLCRRCPSTILTVTSDEEARKNATHWEKQAMADIC